ncbi:nuclear transcription factor Y subunit beta-like isoform X3 [Portunus trituberculatus]|nr:nuclear transcription factor Y subunit beta-like isoform X3 [Portunus trituberculatus]
MKKISAKCQIRGDTCIPGEDNLPVGDEGRGDHNVESSPPVHLGNVGVKLENEGRVEGPAGLLETVEEVVEAPWEEISGPDLSQAYVVDLTQQFNRIFVQTSFNSFKEKQQQQSGSSSKMEGAESDDIGASFLTSDQYMVEAHSVHSQQHEDEEKEELPHVLREQDRFLPIANVARIMKRGIPKTGKIAKDARECVQECVSEFISFVTSEASDRCHQEKRKTINGEDILWAMNALGFENYVEPLKIYLQKFRESTKGDKPLEGSVESSYEVEFGNSMPTFTTDHVSQSEIVCTYGPGQVTQQFTLG